MRKEIAAALKLRFDNVGRSTISQDVSYEIDSCGRKIYYCYSAANLVNGKVYIGFAADPKVRWREHKRDAEKGKGYAFAAAIRKYGWENFQFEVICCGKNKREMLEHVEPALIVQYGSGVPNGYNIRRTAMIAPCFLEFGKPSSTRIKPGQRLSPATEFKKGTIPPSRKGIPHTEEVKSRIRESMKTLLSDSTIREQRRCKALGNRSRTGQKHSVIENNKHRLSEAVIERVKELRGMKFTYVELAIRLNEEGHLNKWNRPWKEKGISALFERLKKEGIFDVKHDRTWSEKRKVAFILQMSGLNHPSKRKQETACLITK